MSAVSAPSFWRPGIARSGGAGRAQCHERSGATIADWHLRARLLPDKEEQR